MYLAASPSSVGPDKHIGKSALLSEGEKGVDVLEEVYKKHAIVGDAYHFFAGAAHHYDLATLVSLGVAPHAVPTFLIMLEWRSWRLGHPLNLALMFARHLQDPHLAGHMIKLHQNITKFVGGPLKSATPKMIAWDAFFYRHNNFGDASHRAQMISWVPPDPRLYNLGASIEKLHENLDHLGLYHFFQEKPRKRFLAAFTTDAMKFAHTARLLGPDLERDLRDEASATLGRMWNEAGTVNYSLLSTLLRTVPADTAAMYLDTVKGVKGGLGICRIDATTPQMVRGLSELGNHVGSPKTLSALYGRAPYAHELLTVRSDGLLNVLDYMPMPVLATVLEDQKGAEQIRARLLGLLTDANQVRVRRCLSDHKDRASLELYPFEGEVPLAEDYAIDKVPSTRLDQWDVIYKALAQSWTSSSEFRTRLQALIPNPIVRIAVASLHLAELRNDRRTKYLPNILSGHSMWPEIEELLKLPRPRSTVRELVQ